MKWVPNPFRKSFFLKTCSNPHKMVLNRKRRPFLVRQKKSIDFIKNLSRYLRRKFWNSKFLDDFWSKMEKHRNFRKSEILKSDGRKKSKKSKKSKFFEIQNFDFSTSYMILQWFSRWNVFHVIFDFFDFCFFGTPSLKWPNSKTTGPISKIFGAL